MGKPSVARLEPVEPRDVWPDEAGDFTPWLAEKENLARLGEVLGTDLQPDRCEVEVGPFRADILCVDGASKARVVIENQLEKSDHSHLGQLLTYAVALDARMAVWVAPEFTRQHRDAVDRLNKLSGESLSLFAVALEVWKIGGSDVASAFRVVCKPEGWTKGPRRTVGSTAPISNPLYREFWGAFSKAAATRAKRFKPPKPASGNWFAVGVGRSDFRIYAAVSTWNMARHTSDVGELRVELEVDHREHFALLEADRDKIQADLGEPPLVWDFEDRKRGRIRQAIDADVTDRAKWPGQIEWLVDRIDRFQEVLRPRALATRAVERGT